MGQMCSALIWLTTEMKWTSSLERLKKVFGQFRKVRKKLIMREKASKARVKAYSGEAPFTLAFDAFSLVVNFFLAFLNWPNTFFSLVAV